MTPPEGDLDAIIHVPTRLRIVVALATLPAGDSLSFARLQQLLDLTAGNLITHLRKLEDAGYVAYVKSRHEGVTRTSVHLSHAGRAALEQYAATLQRLLGPAVPIWRSS
jgi:DNA-binding MarR family transcriptional regulator